MQGTGGKLPSDRSGPVTNKLLPTAVEIVLYKDRVENTDKEYEALAKFVIYGGGSREFYLKTDQSGLVLDPKDHKLTTRNVSKYLWKRASQEAFNSYCAFLLSHPRVYYHYDAAKNGLLVA